MSLTCKSAKAGLIAGGLSLLMSQTAFASVINVHVPTPSVHISVPTPTLHASTNFHSSTNSFEAASPNNKARLAVTRSNGAGSSTGTGSPGIKALTANTAGSSSNDRTGGHHPVTGNDGQAGSGAGQATGSLPTSWSFRDLVLVEINLSALSAFDGNSAPSAPPSTDVNGVFQYIANGGDDSAYAAVIASFQAAIAAAQQAVDLAASCGVDPSQSGCSSALPLGQAQQNLSNAENAYQTFNSDINYVLWLLAFLYDFGLGGAPAEAAVEAALAACLATPSSCQAAIVAMETELAQLGVPAQVYVGGYPVTVLENIFYFSGTATSQPTLSGGLNAWFFSWAGFGGADPYAY